MSHNITLIGMAGSGKSTIGSLLANQLDKIFIDSDKLIEESLQQPLQQILEEKGYLKLRQIEAEVIQKINMKNAVLATGGSAVYSSNAMEHLSKQSKIIHLHVPLSVIYQRVSNFDSRGLAKHPDQSLEDVFEERLSLYKHFSHISIENILSTDQCIKEIVDQL